MKGHSVRLAFDVHIYISIQVWQPSKTCPLAHPRTREGATSAIMSMLPTKAVSIHAPVRVRQMQAQLLQIENEFQSTHPWGCDGGREYALKVSGTNSPLRQPLSRCIFLTPLYFIGKNVNLLISRTYRNRRSPGEFLWAWGWRKQFIGSAIHFGIADSHLVHQPVFDARWSRVHRPATFSPQPFWNQKAAPY